MKVEMIRTFHPVGQGAFYSEEFSHDGKVVFRVVYDCGCINRKEAKARGQAVVEKWIQGWREHRRIDYLFISHFDYDHVSLLDVLVKQRVAVDRVILPLLCRNEKRTLLNFYRGILGDKEYRMIESVLCATGGLFDEVRKIVYVERAGRAPRMPGNSFDGLGDRDHGGKTMTVPSGTVFRMAGTGLNLGADEGWCYIPCNHDVRVRRRELFELLHAEFGAKFNICSLTSFQKIMSHCGRKRMRAVLKRVYDKLEGGINANSMVVYSGPKCSNSSWRVDSVRVKSLVGFEPVPEFILLSAILDQPKRPFEPGCVYAGDVDLKSVDLKDWYECFWKCVGTIQVPHHGSSDSFKIDAYNEGAFCCPVSCSVERYYGHPHPCVANDLLLGGNFPVFVTEHQWLEQKISSGS